MEQVKRFLSSQAPNATQMFLTGAPAHFIGFAASQMLFSGAAASVGSIIIFGFIAQIGFGALADVAVAKDNGSILGYPVKNLRQDMKFYLGSTAVIAVIGAYYISLSAALGYLVLVQMPFGLTSLELGIRGSQALGIRNTCE